MQPQYYGAAAEYNKPKGFRIDHRILMLVLLGLIVTVFLVVGAILFNSFTSGPKNQFAQLIARENALEKFLNDYQKGVKNSDLTKVSSEAYVLLVTDSLALTKLLSSEYGLKAVPGEIAALESDSTTKKKLEEAERLGKYDQTYMELFEDKLAATLQLAQQTRSENSNSVRKTIDQTITNVQIIQKQLDQIKL